MPKLPSDIGLPSDAWRPSSCGRPQPYGRPGRSGGDLLDRLSQPARRGKPPRSSGQRLAADRTRAVQRPGARQPRGACPATCRRGPPAARGGRRRNWGDGLCGPPTTAGAHGRATRASSTPCSGRSPSSRSCSANSACASSSRTWSPSRTSWRPATSTLVSWDCCWIPAMRQSPGLSTSSWRSPVPASLTSICRTTAAQRTRTTHLAVGRGVVDAGAVLHAARVSGCLVILELLKEPAIHESIAYLQRRGLTDGAIVTPQGGQTTP